MINRKYKKIGKLSKPYYTQNNEQTIDTRLGKIRYNIEKNIGGDKPYDIYRIISDLADRISILETIVKKIDPDCDLDPIFNDNDIKSVYEKTNNRLKEINKIIKEA
jgi:hypothetical protein